jgi:peptide/nickel transport system substrate-binding protein
MDIGIYARPEYYFQYDDADFQKMIADLSVENDPAKRSGLLQAAQQKISDDYVNGYLFQLAMLSVVNAKLEGIWENAPTQAVDMTAVRWVD